VRIDRFLFFIRLVKSRTLAQAIIEQGHVRIDGRRVEKVSEEVRAGSVVALPLHDRVRNPAGGRPSRAPPPGERSPCLLRGIDAGKPAT
jgi:ribosome-associated heat shock protein Hsp15